MVWFTKRLLMKKKGPRNSSVRVLSETKKKQIYFWGLKMPSKLNLYGI